MAPLSFLTATFLLCVLPLVTSLNLPYFSGYISYSNHPPHPHPHPTPSPSGTTCPTIIKTTDSASCPQPTPSPCPVPDCIVLSSIDNPCGCPTSVATVNVYTPCPKGCDGACSTQWTVKQPTSTCAKTTSKPTSKSTSKSTSSISGPVIVTPPTRTSRPLPTITTRPFTDTVTQASTCHTITATEGPECWTPDCEITYSRCRKEAEVTVSCGCEVVRTVTSCRRTCDGGCWTDYATKYLPCAATPSGSGVTRTAPVLTVPTLGQY
ncbi:hypothetical protein WAI453_011877 [Rhynchosporium graminicola]